MRVFDSEIVLSAEVAGAEGVTVKLTALSDVLPENGYIEANAVEDEDQLELMKAAADDILKAENRRVTDLFAADITLCNEDGEAVQPDGSVKLHLKEPPLEIPAPESFTWVKMLLIQKHMMHR